MCLLRYDYFSASRNGCTAPRRIFGGFSNEKRPIFHYLYKDNKIIPRRLEGRYKSFQHFFDHRAISRPFLCVSSTIPSGPSIHFRAFFAVRCTCSCRPELLLCAALVPHPDQRALFHHSRILLRRELQLGAAGQLPAHAGVKRYGAGVGV